MIAFFDVLRQRERGGDVGLLRRFAAAYEQHDDFHAALFDVDPIPTEPT